MVLHWKQLALLSDEQLGKLDIAETNLACAIDLPGELALDVPGCRARLDDFAERVRQETEALLPRFHRQPGDYEGSEAYFRILVMITVLQRDLGVRYNPIRIPEDVPLEVEDVFIHGVLQGEGGTCASMPVVYVAVGRRLGYPLKLVEAIGRAGHLFARWDEPGGERFNIEGTNRGLSCHPDNYYRTGYFEPTGKMERKCCLLRSMTPQEELACFLKQRAGCWKEAGNDREAAESFGYAFGVAPHNWGLEACFGRTLLEWEARLRRLKPPGYPKVLFRWPAARRLPDGVPLDMERAMLGLRATEEILTDPTREQDWWGPMRRGRGPGLRPERVDVSFARQGCKVKFHFGSGRPVGGRARSEGGLQRQGW
jgi:hypothetical protein